MELTTLLFLGFFAAVALLNYTLPRVLRPYCLLAASYLFYCWGANDRLLVPVLVAATLVTWGCGLVIGKCRIGPVRVIFLLLAVFTCVGLLFYYKYWNLLAADILSGTVLQPRTDMVTPLGLGYFTLAALSYTIDVHRGRMKAERDFWRRWHITLGRWFREYVYIPLGGNKKGKFRLVINTFIVWFLTGLWHGAAWNFIIWGMFFFILMMLEKFIYLRFLEKHPIIGYLYMLIIIPVSWVIFNISNLGELKLYLLRMFGNHAVSGVPLGGMEKFVSLFGKYWWMLAICMVCATPLPMRLISRYKNNIFLKILFVFLFWICVYLLSVQKSNPFLYFRF